MIERDETETKLEKRARILLHLDEAKNWRRPPLAIELLQYLDQAAADVLAGEEEIGGD